jgi:hypothetical protein
MFQIFYHINDIIPVNPECGSAIYGLLLIQDLFSESRFYISGDIVNVLAHLILIADFGFVIADF